jgi:hypothetical protein
MKKMNDENNLKMKTMKKPGLFPKKYWFRKNNDGINFKMKMMEKGRMFPSQKKRGVEEGEKQDESGDEGWKNVAHQFFWGKVKMLKIEEEESVLKHNKLDESKDDVKMKKNESMFGSKSIMDEEKWMKVKMRRTRACTS